MRVGRKKYPEGHELERDSRQGGFLFPETKGKMRLPPTLGEMVGLNPARTASSALACIALIRLSIGRVDFVVNTSGGLTLL